MPTTGRENIDAQLVFVDERLEHWNELIAAHAVTKAAWEAAFVTASTTELQTSVQACIDSEQAEIDRITVDRDALQSERDTLALAITALPAE